MAARCPIMCQKYYLLLYFTFMHIISLTMGAVPGTFFWKPRLALDLTIPKAVVGRSGHRPSINNIMEGRVVVVEGYQTGLTILALSAAYSGDFHHNELDPRSATFYTNSYRWAIRYLSLLPPWMAGNAGNYCETHKLWRRRFHYMDAFVPEWIQKALFFVKKEDWDREKTEYKKFVEYAEPTFGKFNRYPGRFFNNFASQRHPDSAENRKHSTSLYFK